MSSSGQNWDEGHEPLEVQEPRQETSSVITSMMKPLASPGLGICLTCGFVREHSWFHSTQSVLPGWLIGVPGSI